MPFILYVVLALAVLIVLPYVVFKSEAKRS